MPVTSVLKKDSQRRRPCEDRSRDYSHVATDHQKLGETHNEFSPNASTKSVVLLIP